MKKPDYTQHDSQYIQLRKNGFTGWGGETFDRRMLGWEKTLENLFSSDLFPNVGTKVLEIGSGAGDTLIPFAEKGYLVSGIEISPAAVQWAKEKFTQKKLSAQVVQGNIAESFPFSDFEFSAVIDGACLHCLISTDRKLALSEIYRVLSPNGFFLVSHMINDPRELDSELTFNSSTRTQNKNGIPYRSMPTYEQLINELSDAGFSVVHESIRANPWWDHAEIWCLKK